jgi:hypothetical protein
LAPNRKRNPCVRHKAIFPEDLQPQCSAGLRVEANDMEKAETISDMHSPSKSLCRGVLNLFCDLTIINKTVADPTNDKMEEII